MSSARLSCHYQSVLRTWPLKGNKTIGTKFPTCLHPLWSTHLTGQSVMYVANGCLNNLQLQLQLQLPLHSPSSYSAGSHAYVEGLVVTACRSTRIKLWWRHKSLYTEVNISVRGTVEEGRGVCLRSIVLHVNRCKLGRSLSCTLCSCILIQLVFMYKVTQVCWNEQNPYYTVYHFLRLILIILWVCSRCWDMFGSILSLSVMPFWRHNCCLSDLFCRSGLKFGVVELRMPLSAIQNVLVCSCIVSEIFVRF